MSLDLKNIAILEKRYMIAWRCISDGAVFFSTSNMLWPVKRGSEKLILKVVDPYDDEVHADDILRFYDGHGSVKLIDSDANIMLLERIVNDTGHPSLDFLALNGLDDQATQIICDVVSQLHAAARHMPYPQTLIPFRERTRALRKLAEQDSADEKNNSMAEIAIRLSDLAEPELLDEKIGRLLEPVAVVNPYAEQLTYGDDRLQSRRDQPKYLNLINAVAFLRQMRKPVRSHNVTPHTFRRNCATELLRGGANMYHPATPRLCRTCVKDLLGHESLDTLKPYARLTILDLKKEHQRCHPREKDDGREAPLA